MVNMKQKIDKHNRKIMPNGREKEEFPRTCNCRDKTSLSPQRKISSRGGSVQSHRNTNRINEAGYIHRDVGKPL